MLPSKRQLRLIGCTEPDPKSGEGWGDMESGPRHRCYPMRSDITLFLPQGMEQRQRGPARKKLMAMNDEGFKGWPEKFCHKSRRCNLHSIR